METGSNPASDRPILKSTAKLSAPESSLTFRGWNYITTSIIFHLATLPSPTNLNGSVCFNTRYGVILIDRDWLVKKHPSQKITTMLITLKVKGIGASN